MRPHEIHAGHGSFFARGQAPIAAALAALSMLLGGFALTARADAPWFTPPSGWQAVSHNRNVLGVWMHQGDTGFHQNIVAAAQRTPYSASQYDEAALYKLRTVLHGLTVGADAATTTCGRPAHYMSYSSVEFGQKVVYERMTTVRDGVAFVLVYTRGAEQPSLPEARNALMTLCGAQIPAQPQPQPQTPAAQPAATPPQQPPAPPSTPGSY